MAGNATIITDELIEAIGDIFYYARGMNQCIRMIQSFYKLEYPSGEIKFMPEDQLKLICLKLKGEINEKTKLAVEIEKINELSITTATYELVQQGYKAKPQVYSIDRRTFLKWNQTGNNLLEQLEEDSERPLTHFENQCLRLVQAIDNAKRRLISENQRILNKNKTCEKNVSAVIQELKWLDPTEFAEKQQVEHVHSGEIRIESTLFDLIKQVKEAQLSEIEKPKLIEDKSEIIDTEWSKD